MHSSNSFRLLLRQTCSLKFDPGRTWEAQCTKNSPKAVRMVHWKTVIKMLRRWKYWLLRANKLRKASCRRSSQLIKSERSAFGSSGIDWQWHWNLSIEMRRFAKRWCWICGMRTRAETIDRHRCGEVSHRWSFRLRTLFEKKPSNRFSEDHQLWLRLWSKLWFRLIEALIQDDSTKLIRLS